jgi:hypothetical protein
MEICGQYFSVKMISRIQMTVNKNSTISRCALSRQVCEWLDRQSPNGKYQDMSCRKTLLELERKGVIVLPVSNNVYPFQQKSDRNIC